MKNILLLVRKWLGLMDVKFLRLVSLISVILVLAGSMLNTAQAASVKDPWALKIVDENGKKLPISKLIDGTENLKLAAGKKYRVTGKVPVAVRRLLKTKYLNFESQRVDAEDPTAWDPLKHILMKKNGSFDEAFTIPKSMAIIKRHYRVSASVESGMVGQIQANNTVSATLMATTDLAFGLQIINDTDSDLEFTIPAEIPADGTSNYGSGGGPITVSKHSFLWLHYVNPPLPLTSPYGPAITFNVQRSSCFLNCQKFYTRWEYQVNGYQSCAAQAPYFDSGQNYYLRVTPQAFTSGYDMFLWGDSMPVCSASLDTKFASWIMDNKGWTSVILGGAAIIATVAMVAVAPEFAPLVVEEGIAVGNDEDLAMWMNFLQR